MDVFKVGAESEAARADLQEDKELMPEPRVLSAAEIMAVAGGPQISNGGG